MQGKRFSIKARIRSFRYAFSGLRELFAHEHNAWIHLTAAVCVVIVGFIFKLSPMEWTIVVLAIGLVFAAEAINTALEALADVVCPERNEQIRKVKDLAAGAVLAIAIAAAIVGIIIFLPKIL